MFKGEQMRAILAIILLLTLSIKNSWAGSPFISAGLIYQNYKDKNFDVNSKILPTIQVGYFAKFQNITAQVQTNRISNFVERDFIRLKFNGGAVELKKRQTYDTFALGYKIGNLNPSLGVSNVKLERNLLNQRFVNYALVYSLNLNYFIDKNKAVQASIFKKNKELGLTTSGLLTYNYYF
jgi:hypothetical protein